MDRSSDAGGPRLPAALLAWSALLLILAGGAAANPDLEAIARQARAAERAALAWYRGTPPAERVAWGGLAASAALGLGTLLERALRLRRGRLIPRAFAPRFLERLRDGRLDAGKALDFCELNPSPASRVALAAVRRWGRPAADLERGVAIAHRIEADRLRRHVGTLRRIAALAPLLGLLGTLFASSRALAESGPAWAPALAAALAPLTTGVALAILALIAYDGLAGKIETLSGELERLGAETVDAIAMSTPPEPRAGGHRPATGSPIRTPHQLRAPDSEAARRPAWPSADFDPDAPK